MQSVSFSLTGVDARGTQADCTIVDLCHAIEPGAVGQAAWLLARTRRDFPPATVFCCVVDPGVGTERRPLAAAADGHFFVAPDNGLLTGLRGQSDAWLQATAAQVEKMVSRYARLGYLGSRR